MAIILFSSGKKHVCSADIGLRIWQILNDQVVPTDAEAAYCEQVKEVYLNKHNAPQDYIDRHHHLFAADTPVVYSSDTFVPESRKDLL